MIFKGKNNTYAFHTVFLSFIYKYDLHILLLFNHLSLIHMKACLFFVFCFSLFALQVIQAQPILSWQKSLGGSGSDEISRIIQISNKGFLILGSSTSTDGQVSGNHGSYDFWAVKVDTVGNVVWQQSYGGSLIDLLFDGVQTFDGGFILAGKSKSNDGQVTGNHGDYDMWIVKIDSLGVLQWQKSLGGSLSDEAKAIQQTEDSGYIVAGKSQSNDGQVSGNHGSMDIWIVKLFQNGDLQWQESLGGSGYEDAADIKITSDHGFIVCGNSNSIDGQVSGNHGDYDFWIVKLASDSTLQWQKSFGGSGHDLALSLDQTSEGGYIIGGQTTSTDGQVTGNHGNTDVWVVKIDTSGNLEWQKCLGGSLNDMGFNIRQIAGNSYILAGSTLSNDMQVTGNHGGNDVWIVKLDATGNLLWQECLGGSADDYGYVIQKAVIGGFIVGGTSNSNDGQVSGNHGLFDYWIVKLAASVIISGTITDSLGNPVNGGNVYCLNDHNFYGGYDTTAVENIATGNFGFTVPLNYGCTIKAIPDSISLQTMLPTYIGNTVLWMEADTVIASSNVNAGTIHLIPRPPAHNGNATIRGKVVKDIWFKANDPIDNVGIVIKKKSKSPLNDLYDYTIADINGLFSFEKVEAGNYSIFMDYPGIPMYTQGGANDISVINPNDTTINLLGKVDSAFIRLFPAVGIENFSMDDPVIKLFPNPSSGKFNLSVKNTSWNVALIQISDLQGRVVYSDELVLNHVHDFTASIDLSGIARGQYFVKIISEKSTKVALLMMQ
jgi:hypothetical protein